MTIALVLSMAAPAGAAPCASASAQAEVAAALARIENSIDPCGQSSALATAVSEYRRCGVAVYPICLDRGSQRSFIERSGQAGVEMTTITWNPELRSELEPDCGGNPTQPVLRDPTASLLHEIVHAVQDCAGLVPADHEFEAVRIENIYRRARGLCQRTRYGTEPLPSSMVVACEPEHCLCQRDGGGLVEAALPAKPHAGEATAAEPQPEQSAGDTKPSLLFRLD